MLAVLDVVRDESSKDAPVRLVFEPKTGKTRSRADHRAAGPHQPGNLGAHQPHHGGAGRQAGAEVAAPDADEGGSPSASRPSRRRSQHRLNKVLDRIHILEGRQLVLLNIDEVIAIIRQAEEPKAALIARFASSDRQAGTSSKSACASWRPWRPSKIEQELKNCARSRANWKTSWPTPARCAASDG